VLPGVSVTLRNTATNYEQTQLTDAAGRFRGVLLPLGRYEVHASLDGFAPQVVKGIDLGGGQTRTVEIKLAQAAVNEALVVTAAGAGDRDRARKARRGSTTTRSPICRQRPELPRPHQAHARGDGRSGARCDELSINGQKGIANNVSVASRRQQPLLRRAARRAVSRVHFQPRRGQGW